MSPHPSPSLRCHEEEVFLMDSPMPCSSSIAISRRVLAAAQGGQEAAEDSTAEDAADAGHQQQQPPRRYYLPFGQNANELSMERKRLHRISLQHHSAQRGEECRQQPQQRTAASRIAAAHGTAEAVAAGGGRAETAAAATGPQETPKNGAKVLGPIDVNIPNNGSRLAQGQQLQPQQHQSSSHSRASRPPRQQPPIGTRKRRAEQQQSSEERLNQKERIWVCADVDRVIHLDGRCLQALLEAEQHVQVGAGQVSRQQQSGDGVEPSARARLVQWLQDVCEEEHADYVVLPLAVAYLDRVLASKFVPRRNLQALGSACLLLASKMKAPQPMVAARLSELTAGNVNAEEMLDWEMVVVNQLQWNLLQATPFEFFDQLLVRSPILEALREDFARCLHSMQKDLCLATQLASVQASACLLFCALRSQRQHLLEESERTIRRHLGLNSVNSLAPLFGNIATAIGGHAASVAVCAKKLNGCSEKQQQQTIHPPSSKRMSLQQSPPVTSDFLSAFGVVDDEVSADGIIASTANEPSTSASSGVPSAASTTRPASNSPPIQQPDEESSRSSTNSSSNESTKTMKLVNDSGYRSSEPASPPVPKPADLLDRNRSDFGPLF